MDSCVSRSSFFPRDPASFLRRLLLGHETLPAGPSLDQRPVHREVFLAQQIVFPRLPQHRLQQALRHLSRHQPLPILREHRHIPHRIIRIQSHKPPVQQVVIQLLHQLRLAADRIQRLQQQRPQQSLRRDRRSSSARVQRLKMTPHLLQPAIHHRPNPPERVIAGNPLFQWNVAEYFALFFVWSAHVVLDVQHSLQLPNRRIFPQPVKP